MSLLAVPGVRPIAPVRATRPRRALVSASVVSKKSTDAVGRARVVSRRPTGRRAVRVSCRASADAGDADDEAALNREIDAQLTQCEQSLATVDAMLDGDKDVASLVAGFLNGPAHDIASLAERPG